MKAKRKHSRRAIPPFGLVVIGIAFVAAVAAWDYYRTFLADNVVATEIPRRGVVEISQECSYEELCTVMTESGILRHPKRFLRAARFSRLAANYKPGCYRFVHGMDNKAIVRTFACGWQEPVQLTFNHHVRTLERLSGVLGEKLEADSAAFAAELLDRRTAAAFGFEPETFLAMFLPNTYEVYWTITPANFINRMYREWEQFWTEERTAAAEAIGLTPVQVSTLASIVVEETRFNDEMPLIAGVYLNRLRKGVPLQADPTVKFLVQSQDTDVTRILNKHLKIDSPYNTYRYRGLPPGPITMPSIAAIDAVLHYTPHNYYYFCARPTFDGRHEFAATYNQHLKNAKAYRTAYRQWEKERKTAAEEAARAATSAPGE